MREQTEMFTRREKSKAVRMVIRLTLKSGRGRGRPKKRRPDAVMIDVRTASVEDRVKRWFRTRLVDPKYSWDVVEGEEEREYSVQK